MGARLGTKHASRKQPEPEINVTPLVDVVLVLLIIFMVVAPALEEGEQIELPAIANSDDEKNDDALIHLTLAANGRILLEKENVAESELEAQLTALHAGAPERKLILNADAALPYEKVRTTFKVVQDVGFRGVKLKVVDRKTPDT